MKQSKFRFLLQLLVIGALIAISSCAVGNGSEPESRSKIQADAPEQHYVGIDSFVYRNHSYLKMESTFKAGSFAVVHNPDCECMQPNPNHLDTGFFYHMENGKVSAYPENIVTVK